tara:strand:+ start:881 stop:1111 length:231 start_codon:yes stop_codon:yes gene_type:complete
MIDKTKKDFKSEFKKTIIWGARSIKVQENNNCSPKLFNKELNIVTSNRNKETRDNTDQVILVSLKKFNNNDRIDCV